MMRILNEYHVKIETWYRTLSNHRITIKMLDYYEILEIQENASSDKIRQAYIKQSLFWHPDKNISENATEKFQQVSEAYYVLRFDLNILRLQASN